ncbi:phosphopantetheine-binding protein [Gordonia humi]|uniref:phosphopantetheine-binding protein n=1 Tax=Gordonia humi TaxID=686429 RepID=UPI0036078330
MYVAGPSLAHGYLDDPAATARAFVADPQRPGERMFCTGDRGRVTETGDLAILGRPDGRMKINGVRLERAEAESALLSMPGVAAAAVVVASTDAGVDTLVGLVEATEPFDRLTTVRGASSSLPPGVAVADVRRLDRLPTLPSGKVDYGALRAAIPHEQRSEPVGAAHRTVADLAAQILGVDDVGVDADLFACGANSMHLVELSRRAREEGFAFTAADVFELRTVGALVDRFAGSRRPAGEGSVTAVSSAPSSRWFTGGSPPIRGTVACPAEVDVSALRERVGRFARDVPALRRTVSVSRRGRIRIAQSEGCAVPVIEPDTDTDDGAGTAVVVDRAAATLTVRASPFVLDTVSARKVAALLISDGDRPEIGGAAVEGSDGVPAGRTHVWSSDGGSRTEVAGRLSSYSGDRAAAARALAAAFVAVTGVRPSLDVEWRPDVETSVLGPLTDLVPADDLDAGGADQLDRRHAAVATAWGSREGRRSLSEERPADVAVMFDERWDTAHPVTVVVADDGSVVAHTSSPDCPPDVLAAVLARWDADPSSPPIT